MALRTLHARAGRHAVDAVGCSYILNAPRMLTEPNIYQTRLTGAKRTISTTPSVFAFEGMRNMYQNLRNRGKKMVGLKSDEEAQMERMLKELEPSKEKSLQRLHRKRWSRPEKSVDTVSGQEQLTFSEHKSSTARFRISPKKLQLLADQIGGGKPLDYSILQMQFSQKRAAKRVKSMLVLARDHAVAKGLDPRRLVVAEAWVGKGRTFKRLEIKGRGRVGVITSPQSYMSVVLRHGKEWHTKQDEKLKKERKILRSIGTGGVVRVNQPIINSHQRAGWQW